MPESDLALCQSGLKRRSVITVCSMFWPLLALLPQAVWAYAVGEAELKSRYSQPLRVAIPVTLGNTNEAQDASEISASLMPLSAYEAAGLLAPPITAEQVDVRVKGSGLNYLIELRSRQLIREPFVTLLLEVRIGSVKLVRELPLIFELADERTVEPPAGPVVSRLTEETPELPMPVAAIPIQPKQVEPDALPTQQKRKLRKPAETPEKRAAIPPPGLTRFVLAEDFSSFRKLAQSGQAPKPAATAPGVAEEVAEQPASVSAATSAKSEAGEPAAHELEAATAPPPVPVPDPEYVPPEAVSEAAPVQVSKKSTGTSLWWWLPGGLLAAAAIFLMLRRRLEQEPEEEIPRPSYVPAQPPWEKKAAEVVAPVQPAVVTSVSAVAQAVVAERKAPPPAVTAKPARAEVPAATEQNFDFGWEDVASGEAAQPDSPEPLAEAIKAPPVAVTAAEPAKATSDPEQLRKRVAELLGRTMDQNHRRKLQLVDAYLDLGRFDSANSLIGDLEHELTPKPSPRVASLSAAN